MSTTFPITWDVPMDVFDDFTGHGVPDYHIAINRDAVMVIKSGTVTVTINPRAATIHVDAPRHILNAVLFPSDNGKAMTINVDIPGMSRAPQWGKQS